MRNVGRNVQHITLVQHIRRPAFDPSSANLAVARILAIDDRTSDEYRCFTILSD